MSGDGPSNRRLVAPLALAALGIVYGDIGTSPLYALREGLGGHQPFPVTSTNVMGALSLVFWALVLVISVKYLAVVLRADNRGEGGVLALMSLATHRDGVTRTRATKLLLLLGILGAALLYGDGIITPAISVLSAVEGVSLAAPALHYAVIPLTIGILVALFLVQRHGTSAVARVFGPITLAWFLALAILGIRGILLAPGILAAVNPVYALDFFLSNGPRGFLILGGVLLVVTGGEALYADMGHFGRRPIRHAWFAIVLPALLLNYFGQGALLLSDPTALESPFYRLAPGWALIPLIVLATSATIIASQAVISGAFSLTMQAVQLGLLPRLRIQHTSDDERGQIYMPEVNAALMVGAIGLVLFFGSSERLAGAYGMSVSLTMAITTLLLYPVTRIHWGWTRAKALLVTTLFFAIDVAFVLANGYKIVDGGWFPLALAAAIYIVMTTWIKGKHVARRLLSRHREPVEQFLDRLGGERMTRVPGAAVFPTDDPATVPLALHRNVRFNKIVHEHVLLVTIDHTDEPRAQDADRVSVQALPHGFYVIRARYGFKEEPDLPQVLERARQQGVQHDPADTTYFLERERFVATRLPSGMAFWRERLFAILARNAQPATTYFRIPTENVVEVGGQVRLELPELIERDIARRAAARGEAPPGPGAEAREGA